MKPSEDTSEHPAEHWRGRGGQAWLEFQQILDAMFKPIEQLLVGVARQSAARAVLDIGCGPGSTTLAIARHLPHAGVTGIDVSALMTDAARRESDLQELGSDFICADAQTYLFSPASFDLLVSRFGVMFFQDPVAAFANLKSAAAKGARAVLTAWRSPEENPFMVIAGKAAQPIIPQPERDPEAPGQFAFADAARVERLLELAGWKNVAIASLDFECQFPSAKLVDFFTHLGPLNRAFPTLDQSQKAAVIARLNEAFEPYVFGEQVKFAAACWQISANVN